MSEYSVARLDEIDEISDGRQPLRPVRHHFGITAFGITAWTAKDAGDRVLNEHDEADDGSEELYFVVQGRAVFELDGERLEAPAGTFVFVPPGVKRTAFAEEPGTTILAVGGYPGEPYEAVGWEVWSQLRPLYEAGEYAAVADRGRELVEANPQYPLLYYNLALLREPRGPDRRRDRAPPARGRAVRAAARVREGGFRLRSDSRRAGVQGTGRRLTRRMTSIQPELWVENPREAVAFYEAAFGATVLHRVGDGDDIVAQLGVGEAAFWVASASAVMKRFSPRALDGATGRTLLVVDDPDRVVRHAVAAGARRRLR